MVPLPVRVRCFLISGLAVIPFAETPGATGPSEALVAAPFAPPSLGDGKTLFTALSPGQTGIKVQNPYDDPAMWGARYREFMGGGMGSGMAAGDFDGDGKVDVFVSTKCRPGRLYRNLGDWKFQDVTEKAGVTEPSSLFSRFSHSDVIWRQGAVFADVDNDGDLDLYVCRNKAANLLYINQGNGTFTEEAEDRGVGLVDGSVVGAFADYDRDGWLDLFVLTNQMDGTEPAGRRDHLFRNVGGGRYVETSVQAGIQRETFGHSATWLDYDGDGWPDLYVANDFAGPDILFRNNGNGTFTDVLPSAAPHTSYSSMGADTADVDNDGRPDLYVADMAPTTREKTQRGLIASRQDAIEAAMRPNTIPQVMRNTLLLNAGRGLFREAACWAGLEATDWTWSVRLEDFDNDGWVDAHVTNGMVREANNSDILSQMMGALSDRERIAVMKAAPVFKESNLAYHNNGHARFEPVTDRWGLGDDSVSFGAVTADFDNDGDLDLMTLNFEGGVSVYRNDVQAAHRVQVRLHGTTSNRFGVGAVVRVETNEGHQAQTLTVSRGYASGSELVAHFGLGNETTLRRLVVEWPSGRKQAFDQLKADHSYLVTEYGSEAKPASEKEPLLGDGTEALGITYGDPSPPLPSDKEQIFIPFRTDRRGPAAAVGDIDGDGQDDVVLGATAASPLRVLHRGPQGFEEGALSDLPASAREDGPILLFDTDGDGDLDLLRTRASSAAGWPELYQPKLYKNDGYGKFLATEQLPDLPINVGAACAADFDGDGDLDLFLGARSMPKKYPENPRSLLLRNEGDRFTVIANAAIENAGLVKSALFSDVDGDGRPDLIVAPEWDCPRYFHNDGTGFRDLTDEAGFRMAGAGWWNSLATADFNEDGRPDFALGNVGLNTPYHASVERPALLYYGDFAQNGTKLMVEATRDQGGEYPLRSRGDLGSRIPTILRRFRKNDDFARADLRTLFGDAVVREASRREATCFESGVLLSQADGRYHFVAFPALAQVGPIYGIAARDINGDGHVDILAVQNSDVANPRFDGGIGLFLAGSGNGTFEVIDAAESGVAVSGNGAALASVDAGGIPAFLYTRTGGRAGALVPRALPERWITLRLRGAAANRFAIGAVVDATFSDGTHERRELQAGGGWLSQGSLVLPYLIQPARTLTQVDVTWPDGTRTAHRNPPKFGPWTISTALSEGSP